MLALMRRSLCVKRAALHGFFALVFAALWLISLVIDDTPEFVGPALILTFFAFWMVWNASKGSREVMKWRRVMAIGTPAQGAVTGVNEVDERWSRWTWKPGWVVSYRYPDSGGKVHTGKSGMLSRRQARRWKKGEACVVLFNPQRPEESVWIGKRSGSPMTE